MIIKDIILLFAAIVFLSCLFKNISCKSLLKSRIPDILLVHEDFLYGARHPFQPSRASRYLIPLKRITYLTKGFPFKELVKDPYHCLCLLLIYD